MAELQWRTLEMADAPALAVLFAETEQVDRTGEHLAEEDVEQELANPTVDLSQDSWAVLDGDRLVGCGQLIGDSQVWDVFQVWCFGLVHPAYRGRGIGRRLLAEQLVRGEQLHRERHPGLPARISTRPSDHVTPAVALARAAGLTPVRQWFDMERDLGAGGLPTVALDAELRLVTYTADRDDEVRRAHNEAFREHFGSTERDPVGWKQWFTGGRSFRPELSFLVLDGGADGPVAGYLLGYFHEADARATGVRVAWIGQLGTRPAWRGRRIGTALLAHALPLYRELGYEQAALDVDTANGSGALGLYQRLGFQVQRSSTCWAREVPAG